MVRFLYLLIFSIFGITCLVSQQHNFYLGADVGLSNLSARKNEYTINNSPFYKSLANKKRVGDKSALGGIFAGYLFRIANFGLGSEVFWQYSAMETSTEEKYNDDLAAADNEIRTQYKLTGRKGLNIRTGYFFDNYFVYALVGWQQQKVRYKATLTIQDPLIVNNLSQYSQIKNNNVSALSFGLGIQKAINENYAIGIELKITRMPKKTFNIHFQDEAYDTKLSSKLRRIQTQSALLRVMYTF